jgi:hypothetical protein
MRLPGGAVIADAVLTAGLVSIGVPVEVACGALRRREYL